MMSARKRFLLKFLSLVIVASLVTGACKITLSWPTATPEQAAALSPTVESEGAVVPAPTGVALQALEIVSERELTTEEFFQVVEADDSFDDVYALAVEQGYDDAQGGGEFVLSDGSVMRGLILGWTEEELVVALQLEAEGEVESLLARVEPERETVVLYNRDGRAELSAQGIEVLAAATNPLDEGESAKSSGLSGLGRPLQQYECDDPSPHGWSWEDYRHCVQRFLGPGSNVGERLGANIEALNHSIRARRTEARRGLLRGFVSVFANPQVVLMCIKRACRDDPPTAHVDPPWLLLNFLRDVCMDWGELDARGYQRKYRFPYEMDDDRKPPPVVTCSGLVYQYGARLPDLWTAETLICQTRDCAGHQTELRLEAPAWTEDDIIQVCDFNESCELVSDILARDPTANIDSTGETVCYSIYAAETPGPAETPGVGGGQVKVTLTWDDTTADLDLQVMDPLPEQISKSYPVSSSTGGRLDEDFPCCDPMDALCVLPGLEPSETISWPDPSRARSGEYKVFVAYLANCVEDSGPVEFTVTIQLDDRQPVEHHGRVSYEQRMKVTTFPYEPR